MKPEVQVELQPLFDQCIQDAIDGRITRLDSLWPPVVVSSEGAPFEVWQLLRTWTEAQRAETLDAEKAIAFSENLRRQSRWGEIDHHLLDMLQRELQEKYFIVTGNEDDHFWDREYSLKPGIRAGQVPEPLLRFACYVAVSYKVYGMDFQYLDANYLFGLVEKVRPDMVKKLKEHGTGRLPLNLQKRKTEHFTASANDAFAVIRITARNSTEECCHEVLNYLCELLEQEDFPRSYAVEFKGPEKRYLPITGLPKKGVNQLFACAVQYPGLHPLMERYARLAMRQYEQYTNLSDEQCALPGSFAVFALGMLGQEWQQLVWDYSMSYRYGGIGYDVVLSVDTAQRDSGGAAIPMLYLFDTADEVDEAEAEQYLSKLTAGEFSPLMYESKATARSEFAQFRQMFLLVGGILCAIIGLVGLLNFFNAMMTGILSRRREFAVLQAVGMTNRQLKTMLIYEGLFYAMSSVAVAFILSLAVGPLAGKMLGSMFWFFEYRFTILPVLLTIPVFLLLGWLIPCMMYDNAAKCSVVEQLRDAQ